MVIEKIYKKYTNICRIKENQGVHTFPLLVPYSLNINPISFQD